MKKPKIILMAILFAFGQILALPALAADDSHPTGFYAEAEIAFANFDCPAGLTCPATEGTASQVYPGGMPNDILVAQSDNFSYKGSDLDSFYMETLLALDAKDWMDDYYHVAEFHAEDVDVQEAIKDWREWRRECLERVDIALGHLQNHQKEHNLPRSREHPTVSCPSDEPGQ